MNSRSNRNRFTRRQILAGTVGGAACITMPMDIFTCAARAQGGPVPLPNLPLKTGAKVAFLGDSIIRRAHNIPSPREMSSYARGELLWAKVYDQRYRIETWYDENDPYGRAVSGQPKSGPGFNGANQGLDSDHAVAEFTVPGTLARVGYTAARDPDVILLHIGTNDINSGTDATTLIARLEQNLAALRAAGKWTIISTINPRSAAGRWGWPAGHNKWKHRLAVNAFIASLSTREGVMVFDPNQYLTDRAAASGEEEWLPGFSSDGVHPGARAAQPAGQELAKLLAAMIEPGSVIETDPDRSNLLPNARLNGTSGSNGANVSGTVANNWNVVVANGNSAVKCSKETAVENIEKQVLTITPADADGPIRWDTVAVTCGDIALRSSALVPGDWIQFGAYLEVSAWNGWIAHCCQVTQRQDRSIQWASYAGKPGDRAAEIMPTSGFSGWWYSDPVRIVDGTDRIRPGFAIVEVLKGVAGSGTIKISRPFIRKVNDPRPAWKL